MQILKEEVRHNIIRVALEEFEINGFQKTTMRNIACRANITVGNLYRYFKNKDDLFDTIIKPAFQEIYHFIGEFATLSNNERYRNDQEYNFIESLEKALIRIYDLHRAELVILLTGSKGSHMENARKEIVELIADRIKKEILPNIEKDTKSNDAFLAEAFSVSFIEGASLVLGSSTNKARTKELFVQFSRIYFKYFLEILK